MKPYLTQIKVPIYTKKGKKSEMTLVVHRELRNEIYGAFEEMQKMKFPIDPTCTAGYSWRMMASNSASISHHSYGCVVDINWTHNGATYTAWPYKPGKDKLSVTNKVVNIWKNMDFIGAVTGHRHILTQCILHTQIIKSKGGISVEEKRICINQSCTYDCRSLLFNATSAEDRAV